jgi:hypothetical protein
MGGIDSVDLQHINLMHKNNNQENFQSPLAKNKSKT